MDARFRLCPEKYYVALRFQRSCLQLCTSLVQTRPRNRTAAALARAPSPARAATSLAKPARTTPAVALAAAVLPLRLAWAVRAARAA